MLPEKLLAARLVVTCTEYARALLLARYPALRADRVVCVHHGLDTALYRPAGPPARDEFGVLAVGRLVPKKGFDVLLRGFARARSALRRGGPTPALRLVLAIVGEGPERKRLEALVRELELGDSVRMPGELAAARVREELAGASVLVAPSVRTPRGDSDGLPNAVLEAMACGRPVLASRLAGLPEAVIDGRTGFLFPPGNDEALAALLARLARNPELAARLGREARLVAEERFSLEVSSRRLIEQFRRIGAPL